MTRQAQSLTEFAALERSVLLSFFRSQPALKLDPGIMVNDLGDALASWPKQGV